MTTKEAVAQLNTTTPFLAILAFGNVTIYSGAEHDAEIVAKMWAADALLAQMVIAFVEIYKQNKTGTIA